MRGHHVHPHSMTRYTRLEESRVKIEKFHLPFCVNNTVGEWDVKMESELGNLRNQSGMFSLSFAAKTLHPRQKRGGEISGADFHPDRFQTFATLSPSLAASGTTSGASPSPA